MAKPKSNRPPNRFLEERRERERQQRAEVIVEFEAGGTEATLRAMAAEIVQYRRALAGVLINAQLSCSFAY